MTDLLDALGAAKEGNYLWCMKCGRVVGPDGSVYSNGNDVDCGGTLAQGSKASLVTALRASAAHDSTEER